MKCPLRKEELITRPDLTQYSTQECLKEECAWWLEGVELCSIKDLALETQHIQFRLQDIASKTPLGKR